MPDTRFLAIVALGPAHPPSARSPQSHPLPDSRSGGRPLRDRRRAHVSGLHAQVRPHGGAMRQGERARDRVVVEHRRVWGSISWAGTTAHPSVEPFVWLSRVSTAASARGVSGPNAAVNWPLLPQRQTSASRIDSSSGFESPSNRSVTSTDMFSGSSLASQSPHRSCPSSVAEKSTVWPSARRRFMASLSVSTAGPSLDGPTAARTGDVSTFRWGLTPFDAHLHRQVGPVHPRSRGSPGPLEPRQDPRPYDERSSNSPTALTWPPWPA